MSTSADNWRSQPYPGEFDEPVGGDNSQQSPAGTFEAQYPPVNGSTEHYNYQDAAPLVHSDPTAGAYQWQTPEAYPESYPDSGYQAVPGAEEYAHAHDHQGYHQESAGVPHDSYEQYQTQFASANVDTDPHQGYAPTMGGAGFAPDHAPLGGESHLTAPSMPVALAAPEGRPGERWAHTPMVPLARQASEQGAEPSPPLQSATVPLERGSAYTLEEPEAGVDRSRSGLSSARLGSDSTLEAGDVELSAVLSRMLDMGASDLHLTDGAYPMVRVRGHLQPLDEFPRLHKAMLQRVLFAILKQRQREKLETELELDFAYSLPGRSRFRVNYYRQREAFGAAFRAIPYEVKPLAELGVPERVAEFAKMARGLVLVTGPTGSGKSTTLASIIDVANRTRAEHIMTVEDPIEFLHRHQRCLVNQREVGEDTHSFADALKHALRQDPDIILVGEMRELETIQVALTAAETGHLVFGTLHTQDAAQTVDRIIDVFPPDQQQQVQTMLAGALQGVISQTLCRTSDGAGRALACEVLVATPAIRSMIREGKTHQIYSAMQSGGKHGMQTMDQHLAFLVSRGIISMETGLEKCHQVEDFNRLVGRG